MSPTTDFRGSNSLLGHLSFKDYALLGSSLSLSEGDQGQTLYHPGDPVESVYFPCGRTLLSMTVAADEARDVDAVLVGCEGAIGGIIGGGFLPAYARIAVRVGGPMARLPVRKLNEAKHESDTLRRLFERYSDYFVAHQSQHIACNAAHSVEQRAAKWICKIVEHTGEDHVALTHEEVAGLLGIARSYFTRVIQPLRTQGILDTTRGEILIRDLPELQRRSCACNDWLKRHYAEVVA